MAESNSFQRTARSRFNITQLGTTKAHRAEQGFAPGSGPGGQRFEILSPRPILFRLAKIQTDALVLGPGALARDAHECCASCLSQGARPSQNRYSARWRTHLNSVISPI